METKFTKGPWRISRAKPTKARGFDILAGYSKMVAAAPAPNDLYQDSAERTANARLIAAAPDLYAALEAIEYQMGGETDAVRKRFSDARTAARAALAKARGETK